MGIVNLTFTCNQSYAIQNISDRINSLFYQFLNSLYLLCLIYRLSIDNVLIVFIRSNHLLLNLELLCHNILLQIIKYLVLHL